EPREVLHRRPETARVHRQGDALAGQARPLHPPGPNRVRGLHAPGGEAAGRRRTLWFHRDQRRRRLRGGRRREVGRGGRHRGTGSRRGRRRAAAQERKRGGGGNRPNGPPAGFARPPPSRLPRPTAKATNAPPVAFRLLWEEEVDAKSKSKIATYLVDYLAYGPSPELFPDFVT